MNMDVSVSSEIEEVISSSTRPIVSNLPDSQVKDLTEAFKMFDLNGDGKISRLELGTVLRSLGETITDADLEQMIRDVDANGDGQIDLQEFIDLHATDNCSSTVTSISSSTMRATDDYGVEEALQSAFNVFDSDKDGFISARELHKVLSSLGDDHISMDDCRFMISCVDLDGDQLVDFQEFQTLMSGNPAN